LDSAAAGGAVENPKDRWRGALQIGGSSIGSSRQNRTLPAGEAIELDSAPVGVE
jgi:hypothetical protein